MTRIFGIFLAAALLLGCQQAPAEAQLSEAQRAETREIVREYILENPEIIEEALIELQRRARDREMQHFYDAIASNYAAIYQDERDPRVGPENAQVTPAMM